MKMSKSHEKIVIKMSVTYMMTFSLASEFPRGFDGLLRRYRGLA